MNLNQRQSQWQMDPFILASQAKQVFYSQDYDNSSWHAVLKATPRGYHELDMYQENTNSKSTPVDISELESIDDDDDDTCVRKDCEGIEV